LGSFPSQNWLKSKKPKATLALMEIKKKHSSKLKAFIKKLK